MIRLGVLLLAVAVPLGASLLGCGCDELIITEEFEDFCDGSPCAWEASGPVSQVATYHAGIHGVAIPAGTTLSALEGFGMQGVSVLVRCDASASVQINGTSFPASDSFEWFYEWSNTNTVINVTGTGECVVDDVGFIETCF